MTISTIVEGHGEMEAVPLLLRRLAAPHGIWLDLPLPIRVKRDRFLRNEQEFSRFIQLAVAKAGPAGKVLVLLDADDDCPAQQAPAILQRAKALRGDANFAIVLAVREFESWFLVAASSLAGQCGLPNALQPPNAAEAIRGAKEWLHEHATNGYEPIRDQASLTSRMNIDECRRSRSFQKLEKEILSFLQN